MGLPQFGIFAQGTIAHEFIEFDIRPDTDPLVAGRAIARLRAPAVAAGGVNLVLGFGADLWRTIAPEDVPFGLAPFTPIGHFGGHHAPATQHDVWLWINGSSRDVVFEHARAAALLVADVAAVATDQVAFVHRDSRDLTGFIDGSANPDLLDAPRAALVPEGQPGAGGSFVLFQRWVHDLAAFEALPTAEQERTFGRSKPDSIEFTGDALPENAHIARTQISEAAGAEIPIYRRSVPYGTIGEHGLQFVAFAADRARLDTILARMFGTSGDGIHDHLMDFSRPVSGAYYYAPSLDVLTLQAQRFEELAATTGPTAGDNVPGVPARVPEVRR